MSDDVLYQSWVRELQSDLAKAEARALKAEAVLRGALEFFDECWRVHLIVLEPDWVKPARAALSEAM